MVLGTTAAAVAGSLATGAASAAGSSLFGKLMGGGKKSSTSSTQFTPSGFNAGGINSTFKNNKYSITSSAERKGIVGGISNSFSSQAGEIRSLRDRVAPGVSELRSSRLSQIENARARAIGDLRENLASRRVMGSSFASDALARAEAEFAKESERVEAESFLQELELTNQLIGQEFEASRSSFATYLSEMNLQADIATKLVGQASAQMADASKFRMELAAKEAEGAGRFFGDTFKPVFDSIGEGVKVALS